MTHSAGHNENSHTNSLGSKRRAYVNQMAMPPRSTGFIVSGVERVISTAPEVGSNYDRSRTEYKTETTDYICEELTRDMYDGAGNVIPNKDAFTDNERIIGLAIAELGVNLSDTYDGKLVTRRKKNLLGKREEITEVRGGRFSESYKNKKTRLKRVGSKALGVTAAGSGAVAAGAAYSAWSPGVVGTGLAIAGGTAAYVGTTIYKPKPANHREHVDFKDSVEVGDITESINEELTAMGLEQDKKADANTVHNSAQAHAEAIKGRSQHKKALRRISQTISRHTQPGAPSLDLDRLRVAVAVEVADEIIRHAREKEMKKERRKRGVIRRAIAGVALAAVTVGAIHVVQANNAQEEERLQQIDPIHHGDTSNEVDGDYVDNFLPGPGGPSVTITAPPAGH